MSFKSKLIFKVIFFQILLTFLGQANAKIENQVIAYIDEKIITSEDIRQEIIYLNIVSGEKLNELKKEKQQKIALDSLINQNVKEIEISKYDTFSISEDGVDFYLKKLFLKNNINNLTDFEMFLKSKNYNLEKIKNKITIDLLWNNLILNIYSNQIKIDKEKIKKKLKSFELQEKIEEYLISEIYIYEENIDKLNKKIKIVVKDIEEKSFEYAAINYSKSASAENEGKLDWMNEKEINDKMLSEIKKLKVGEVSDPIQDMSGIFFFKLNDKKETENKINLNIELKKILDIEKNKQLNFFSSNHFNKLKEHSIIKIINE